MLDVIGSPEDRAKAKVNFDRALRGEHLLLQEEYGDSKLYRTSWENRYSPIYDDQQCIIGLSVFVMDITEKVKMEQSLRETIIEREILKERERLLDSLGEGVYCVTPEGLCTFINPAALMMLGYKKEEVISKNTHELFHHHFKDGSVFPSNQCPINKAVHYKKQFRQNEWLFKKTGKAFLCRLVATPILKNGQVQCVVVAFSDITAEYIMQQQLHRANQQLERLSNLDHLTQIYNRRYFEKNAQQALEKAVKDRQDFSIILFDIDFFKRINDTYGHKIGDRILQLVANTVQNILPTHTIFARIGGEEFVIALVGYNIESTIHLAENIRQHIEHAKLYYNAIEMGCTVSIGVAIHNTPITKVEFLLTKADKKMYAAKIAGRNRVEI